MSYLYTTKRGVKLQYSINPYSNKVSGVWVEKMERVTGGWRRVQYQREVTKELAEHIKERHGIDAYAI